VIFDQLWIRNLVQNAMARLEKECAERGTPWHQAVVLSLFRGRSHEEIATELATTKANVANWIHAAKKKVRAYVRAAIEEYSSSEGELSEELKLVRRTLA
jgi:DNA-directed RNA polymerase specialized sigma24 family protein